MHQNEMFMTMFVDPQACKIMLSFIPKQKCSINHAFKIECLTFNHACKDKWLGIQVHSQDKIKVKPASKMVSEQNIPTKTQVSASKTLQ